MSPENWSPQPYAWEELISFDRLKRAVSARVVKRLEAMMETEPIVDPEVIGGLTREEWQRAKEAVRSSPAAREAYKRFVETEVGKQVTEFLTKDRAELETLGVAEKAL
jgi:glutamyl-tRNA reductase